MCVFVCVFVRDEGLYNLYKLQGPGPYGAPDRKERGKEKKRRKRKKEKKEGKKKKRKKAKKKENEKKGEKKEKKTVCKRIQSSILALWIS